MCSSRGVETYTKQKTVKHLTRFYFCLRSLVKDVLLPYLELKDEDADHSWCEQIPDEVLFKHAVNVFNLSMNYAT